jgi:hypothetical protein
MLFIIKDIKKQKAETYCGETSSYWGDPAVDGRIILKLTFEQDQDGTSSILVVLESCHQTCMTYTSVECKMENS